MLMVIRMMTIMCDCHWDYDVDGNTLNSSETNIILVVSRIMFMFLMISKDAVDVHWDYDHDEYPPETSGNSKLLMAITDL